MRHRVKATVQLTHGDGFGVDDAVDYLHKRGTSSFRYSHGSAYCFPKEKHFFNWYFEVQHNAYHLPNRNIFIGTMGK